MKAFSELTSASQVNNEDLLAISQTSGSGYASKKTTVKDVTDKANHNVADEYDNTSTYAVGVYVMYESTLYKCTTAVSSAENFDSTKWTAVLVTDEMGSGGGGTGGHTIIDENGNSMTARAGLQFVGGANVSDDGTNNKTIVDLASAGGIDGVFIDADNVIQAYTTFTTEASYTATEDCIVVGSISSNTTNTAYITVDGAYLYSLYGTNSSSRENSLTVPIYLKKGQTVLFHNASDWSNINGYTVYGIQTGTTHSKFQPVIYSTEEREIGVWTDGKPLYEKTWDFGSDLVCNSNSWTDTPITKGDIEKIVDIKAVNNAGTIWDMLGANTDQTYVQVYHNRGSNNAISIRYATLQYTKSTDIAGSGTWTPQGVPAHHYSTDEQVIGTWIDGSTLYEKTIPLSSAITLDSNIWTSLGITMTNCIVKRIWAICERDGTSIGAINGVIENNILKALQTRGNTGIEIDCVTVQYTKTS